MFSGLGAGVRRGGERRPSSVGGTLEGLTAWAGMAEADAVLLVCVSRSHQWLWGLQE